MTKETIEILTIVNFVMLVMTITARGKFSRHSKKIALLEEAVVAIAKAQNETEKSLESQSKVTKS